MDKRIRSIGDQLDWAEFKVDDTESDIETILTHVTQLSEETDDVTARLRAIFRQDGRADPVREKARAQLIKQFAHELAEKPALAEHIKNGGDVQFSVRGKAAQELNQAEIKAVLDDAVALLEREREKEKDAEP